MEIWSRSPERKIGEGVLKLDHLSSLPIVVAEKALGGVYAPNMFPANWQLRTPQGQFAGELLWAWVAIRDIQSRLAEAEREEAMTR